MKPELIIPEGALVTDHWADEGCIIISTGDRYAYVYREFIAGDYEVSLGFHRDPKKRPVVIRQAPLGINTVQTIVTTFFTAPTPR